METRRFAVCFKDGCALSLSSLGERQSGLGEFCCLANLDVLPSDKLGLSTAFLNCWDWDYALQIPRLAPPPRPCRSHLLRHLRGAAAVPPPRSSWGWGTWGVHSRAPCSYENRLWAAFERGEERAVGQRCVRLLKREEQRVKPWTSSENGQDGTCSAHGSWQWSLRDHTPQRELRTSPETPPVPPLRQGRGLGAVCNKSIHTPGAPVALGEIAFFFYRKGKISVPLPTFYSHVELSVTAVLLIAK